MISVLREEAQEHFEPGDGKIAGFFVGSRPCGERATIARAIGVVRA